MNIVLASGRGYVIDAGKGSDRGASEALNPMAVSALQRTMAAAGNSVLLLVPIISPQTRVGPGIVTCPEVGGSGRYSPAQCPGCKKQVVSGHPERKQTSTSYVERRNLSMRMHMRRFTRLTNGFSKKVENHAYQVALHFMYYNFCKIHASLRVAPAMEAGVGDHVWSIDEIVTPLPEPTFGPRGPYKKKTPVDNQKNAC